jgi:acyl dehydratase
VAGYVGLSGDFNPLYADVEHARSGPYGGVVVPAPLIAAVAAGLGSMDVPTPHTVALVGWSWAFKAPVRPGDSISSRWRLNRKRDVADARWGLATWQVEVENQRGELVALGDVVRLVARRDVGGPPEAADAGEGARTGSRRRRRRRGGGNGGPTPEGVPGQLAAEPPPEPDAMTASPTAQPEAVELAGVTVPAEPGAQQPRRRRRRRGNGNGGAGGHVPETLPSSQVEPGRPAQQEAIPEPAPSDGSPPPPEPGLDPFF